MRSLAPLSTRKNLGPVALPNAEGTATYHRRELRTLWVGWFLGRTCIFGKLVLFVISGYMLPQRVCISLWLKKKGLIWIDVDWFACVANKMPKSPVSAKVSAAFAPLNIPLTTPLVHFQVLILSFRKSPLCRSRSHHSSNLAIGKKGAWT